MEKISRHVFTAQAESDGRRQADRADDNVDLRAEDFVRYPKDRENSQNRVSGDHIIDEAGSGLRPFHPKVSQEEADNAGDQAG